MVNGYRDSNSGALKHDWGFSGLFSSLKIPRVKASIFRPIKKSNTRLDVFNWCSIVDAFQTAAMLAQEDYKLKHLAEQFRLADNLI